MKIILKSLHMENFKIFQNKTIDFAMMTKIFAQNYTGKSSIFDAFSWVLFGKSATGNAEGKQFIPRRYEVDADGNQILINHVDVIVEINMEANGRPIIIRKVQKQNWVRKRGSEETTYEGDTNEYFWNEVKVSETDHKRRVDDIVDESIFRMVTSPNAFVSMKQDEQRKFLVEKIAQITDMDVLECGDEFQLLRELFATKTLEEIKAINKKTLQGYKEKQISIPIRIDETSKLIVDIDFSEQELSLAALKTQNDEIERKIADTSIAYEEATNLKTEIAEWKGKLSEIETTEKFALTARRRISQTKFDDAYDALRNAISEKNKVYKDVTDIQTDIDADISRIHKLQDEFMKEKANEYDPAGNICSSCGQELPENMKSKCFETWQENHKKEIDKIEFGGKKLHETIEANRLVLKQKQSKLDILNAEIEKLTAAETIAKDELLSIPIEPSFEENATYIDIKNTVTALENSLKQTIESLNDTDTIKAELVARKGDIQSKMDTVKSKLARKLIIDDARNRVDQLRNELRQATANIAECEKLDFEIDRFEKVKRGMLSERINKKFKRIKWQLYRQQKNGGIEDVCVCTINGAPYGENTTSTTERLMAGLDIITTLQNIYGVYAPIFIDNCESYNGYNIPEMPCQMVELFVSDIEEMKVEVSQ